MIRGVAHGCSERENVILYTNDQSTSPCFVQSGFNLFTTPLVSFIIFFFYTCVFCVYAAVKCVSSFSLQRAQTKNCSTIGYAPCAVVAGQLVVGLFVCLSVCLSSFSSLSCSVCVSTRQKAR